MTTPPASAPVLSRPVAVDEITADGIVVTLDATTAERAALASLNGLVALKTLRAPLRVRPEPGGGFRVTGEVLAEVTQTCVISLLPFDAALREPVDVLFLPPAALAAFRADHAGPTQDDAEMPDEPDLIEHGRIDIGALAAEHLTLGLDPYPRRPGASLAPQTTDDAAPASPFAVLRTLREDRS